MSTPQGYVTPATHFVYIDEEGAKWEGDFQFRLSPSLSDANQVGQIRRRGMGGGDVATPMDQADYVANHGFAELAVFVVQDEQTPDWWRSRGLAAKLPPDVYTALYGLFCRLRDERLAERQKVVAAARAALGADKRADDARERQAGIK